MDVVWRNVWQRKEIGVEDGCWSVKALGFVNCTGKIDLFIRWNKEVTFYMQNKPN